jgi:hypothetical protein
MNKFMVVVLVFQLTAMLYLKKRYYYIPFPAVFHDNLYFFIRHRKFFGHNANSFFFETQCWIFTPAFSRLKNGIQTAYKSNTTPKMNSKTITIRGLIVQTSHSFRPVEGVEQRMCPIVGRLCCCAARSCMGCTDRWIPGRIRS